MTSVLDKKRKLVVNRRNVLIAMSLYMVILFLCMKLARTDQVHGWGLYVVAMLPAMPVISVLVSLARYLKEETDEYLRMLTVRSLIVAAGAMLGSIVINDFLRVIAHTSALSPFVCLAEFFIAFGIAQFVQETASRSENDG